MAEIQYQIESLYVNETTDDQFQVGALYLNETAAAAPPAGLSIPIAMHHYKQLMGVN